MSIVVVDGKFETHPFNGSNVEVEVSEAEIRALVESIQSVRIPFASFADGRGFSIARRFRQLGFTGIIRAHGNLLADQYPLAVRSGIDEIEISKEHAKRQPEPQWADAYQRIERTYLDRLKSGLVADAA